MTQYSETKQSAAASYTSQSGAYYNYPVSSNVVENDIVMSITDIATSQAPLKFIKAVNGGQSYYPALYGVAKNVNAGYADVYMEFGSIIPGFNFGAFIGVDYYLDPANPGKLTWAAPAVGSTPNAIKIGRAMDASHLILAPQGNFVQLKGGIYTSDGSYDEVLSPGSNGQVPYYNSAVANGMSVGPAIVTSAPLTYTTATRTLSIVTATNSVAGALSPTDHTTYSAYAAAIALKAPLSAPTFTGDVTSSSGNVLVSTIGKGLQVKTGANSKIGSATLVAGTVTVANTSVTANSSIQLTVSSKGGTQGFLSYTLNAGAGFTISSSSVTETSTVQWHIIERIP